jgi:hypothetical protein
MTEAARSKYTIPAYGAIAKQGKFLSQAICNTGGVRAPAACGAIAKIGHRDILPAKLAQASCPEQRLRPIREEAAKRAVAQEAPQLGLVAQNCTVFEQVSYHVRFPSNTKPRSPNSRILVSPGRCDADATRACDVRNNCSGGSAAHMPGGSCTVSVFRPARPCPDQHERGRDGSGRHRAI